MKKVIKAPEENEVSTNDIQTETIYAFELEGNIFKFQYIQGEDEEKGFWTTICMNSSTNIKYCERDFTDLFGKINEEMDITVLEFENFSKFISWCQYTEFRNGEYEHFLRTKRE